MAITMKLNIPNSTAIMSQIMKANETKHNSRVDLAYKTAKSKGYTSSVRYSVTVIALSAITYGFLSINLMPVAIVSLSIIPLMSYYFINIKANAAKIQEEAKITNEVIDIANQIEKDAFSLDKTAHNTQIILDTVILPICKNTFWGTCFCVVLYSAVKGINCGVKFLDSKIPTKNL